MPPIHAVIVHLQRFTAVTLVMGVMLASAIVNILDAFIKYLGKFLALSADDSHSHALDVDFDTHSFNIGDMPEYARHLTQATQHHASHRCGGVVADTPRLAKSDTEHHTDKHIRRVVNNLVEGAPDGTGLVPLVLLFLDLILGLVTAHTAFPPSGLADMAQGLPVVRTA